MPEEHIFEVLGVIVRQQRSYVEVQEKTLGEYIVDEHSVFIHGHGSRNDLNEVAPFEASVERNSEDRLCYKSASRDKSAALA